MNWLNVIDLLIIGFLLWIPYAIVRNAIREIRAGTYAPDRQSALIDVLNHLVTNGHMHGIQSFVDSNFDPQDLELADPYAHQLFVENNLFSLTEMLKSTVLDYI
jgi:hypothetical protein